MKSSDAPWLVKSGGRILGPFDTAKIGELLRSREISILDEISRPMRRWQTIQYHEDLRDVVESLRKATLSERTEASWTPNTAGLTQTVTDVGGEMTEEITGDLDGFTMTAKEIVVDDVREQRTGPQANTSARFQTRQMQNVAIQRQAEKTTRGLWAVTAFILIAAAVFILQKRMGSFDGARPSPQNIKQTVVGFVQIGHYADALRELKSYYSDPMQSGDLAIYFGPLLIQLESQTVMGRRLLNLVMQSARPEIKQAHTGLGLADLIDGQLDSAQEHFEKALQEDPQYMPALINMASLNVQKGDYAQAKALALKTTSTPVVQGESLITLAEAQLYLYKKDGDLEALDAVTKMLREYITGHWDFAPELSFYELYFTYLKHGTNGLDERIAAFLDIDPRLTSDHKHNVFIYRGRANWKVLARLCEQMVDKLGESPRVAAFMSACHAQEQRWDAARRWIEKAVHQSPKDPLIQAWYSMILRESGDADQASVILGRANEYNRKGEVTLPFVFQARFCQQAGEVECAKEAWSRIHERDSNNLPAIAGLAWAHMQTKNRGETMKLLQQGLRLSNDYIPLLELRQQAEGLGWYATK